MIKYKAVFDQILNDSGIFEYETIDFTGKVLHISGNGNDIEFYDCIINANSILFENINSEDIIIKFENCILNTEIIVQDCLLNSFSLIDTKYLQKLTLKSKDFKSRCIINKFEFYNHYKLSDILPADIVINNYTFKNEFIMHNINHAYGCFSIYNNVFGFEGNDRNSVSYNYQLRDCIFSNSYFRDNIFLHVTTFKNSKFIEDNEKGVTFLNNTFDKIEFSDCTFETLCTFLECEFNSPAYFENLKAISALVINDCIFKSTTTFNRSSIGTFALQKSTFNSISSFQEVSFNTIYIDKTIFEKGALFDDVIIKEIEVCDRRTLRNIKQQLQKVENKIDYNRLRGYELAAYYKELKWNWNGSKDKFILSTTKFVTGFDHSWRRALLFTLSSAILFYSLFFISENYMLDFDIFNWKAPISGYFRFLLVTDFYNPLKDDRTYIDNSNTIGWFVFILGKIVIAFGIYEMIQAFRKFKA